MGTSALPYGLGISLACQAKAAIDNCRAGRAAKGASPFVRTSKSTNFDKRFVDFSYLYKLLILSKKGGSGLAV